MRIRSPMILFKVLFLAGMLLQSGFTSADENPEFSFDRSALTEAKPWTSENFRNNPENFQFAIVGDRTGGADHRDIFARAIAQINLLQPEFVINVGDLIEGYSEDKAKLNAEWDEVDAMFTRLEMPFFRTVGNHDLGNETMKEVWLERHGPTYYHFVYHDVLFLVLNTEDPPRPSPEGMEDDIALYNKLQVEDPDRAKAMLDEFMAKVASYLGKPANFSEQQVAYVDKALKQNADVRWTFLFLHEPAWENPSENFLAIEQLLENRNYTFFAGHLHYYHLDERFGRDYITMGPAGASFHKEGPGNVDHIVWVTMREDGPRIAKITLDGIYDRKGRDLQLKGLYDRSREAQ